MTKGQVPVVVMMMNVARRQGLVITIDGPATPSVIPAKAGIQAVRGRR